MRRLYILHTVVIVFVLLTSSSAGQEQPRKATVHIIAVDGFGLDLGDVLVDLFKDVGNDRDLSRNFRKNTAKDIPYGVYQLRVHMTGFFTSQVTTQVFQPEIWVVVGLRYGEELPEFRTPRLKLTGVVKNFDLMDEPIYIRLVGVYSNFMMDTKVNVSSQSGTFTLAGIIPDGKYILITTGRTGVLDVRQLKAESPAKEPIVIDLKPTGGKDND